MNDPNPRNYPGEEQFYNRGKIGHTSRQPSKPFVVGLFAVIGVLVAILVVMAGILIHIASASQGNASHPTAPGGGGSVSTQAVPTSAPAATLPCTVTTNDWPKMQGWVVNNGILYNDGTTASTLIAPCQIDTPNYAVEAKIQLTKVAGGGPCCTFGIIVRREAKGQNNWQEYDTGLLTAINCFNIAFIADNSDGYSCWQIMTSASFVVDTLPHTYRVEVKDNTIKLFIDGAPILAATDNRLLTTQGDQAVGLFNRTFQLQVSGFQITALH